MRGKWGISYALPCLFAWACLFLCERKPAGKIISSESHEREDFQISLQIFCTALHKVFSKLLLKKLLLRIVLPIPDRNKMASYGVSNLQVCVGCILAEITI